MRRSYLSFLSLLAFLFVTCQPLLHAQNITYQSPDSFFACGEATFSFTVQNPFGNTLNNPSLTVNFTTTLGTDCGISYVVGSATAPATEGNIANLSAPQFTLQPLAAGASQTFTISASADCLTAACIDNAEVFVNSITFDWTGGTTTLTTNPYTIDRALLLVTNVSSTVMSGSRDDVLHRSITLRNTRPGALSSFVFTDVYQPGIAVTSAQGTPLPSPLGSFSTELGAADFASVGDGDGLFEFNESIVITEDITILSCGVDEASAVSNISASWGCGGAVCQEEKVTAVVILKPYEKEPTLTWEPILKVPECFCGPNGYQQGMKITNTGDGMALDVRLDIAMNPQNPRQRLDPTSVRLDSSGTDLDFQLTTMGTDGFSDPCDAPPGLVSSFAAFGFSLAPGASVTVFWDNYYCSDGCGQPVTSWRYKYSYFKQCPPNIFVQQLDFIRVVEQGLALTSLANLEVSQTVMDGQTYTSVYEVNYDSLSLLSGTMTVDIALPCGMEWAMGNEMLLNGEAPLGIDLVVTDTSTTVSAMYQLPLSANTATMQFDFVFHCDSTCGNIPACDHQLQTSCANPCIADPPPIYIANITTSLNKCGNYPAQCNIQSCTDLLFAYQCETDSICLDQPPGYLRYDFSALRKNYGLPDNDNDQFADAPFGLPDLALVERHRFMPGDTVQATIRGAVVMDEPGSSLPLGEVELSFLPGTKMASSTTLLLLTPNGFTSAGAMLRIFDSSAATWYECPDPAFTNSDFIRYKYDLSVLAGGCLPAGFAFAEGDSLHFVGNYRINLNPPFELAPDLDPLLGNIFASPAVRLYDENVENYTPINCYCTSEEMQITYYQHILTPATFALPPCDTSAFNQAMGFRLDLHQGNFFPFEHRNLLSVDDLLLELPPSVEVCTSRLISLRFQGGPNIASQVFYPPNFQNGGYFHDLTPLQSPPLDEGFSANLNFLFKNACTNKFSMPLGYHTTLNWAPGLPQSTDPQDFSLTANSLRPLIANLSIEAPLYDLTSFSNQLTFDFLLKNTPTLVSSVSSGPAPNAWMYVTSQSGLVTNFQLIDQTTGQPVPSANGVWQLGDLPVNPMGFPYRLVGTNNSCEREALQIHYGWDCDPLQSTVQSPCYEQVLPLFIESPPGEIDMIVTSPTGCSALCDTIPYHEIEVFNAQLGSVYDLRVKALLPPGMSVLPGSCVVEYPTGSGSIYPIGDPTPLGTGVLEWNLSLLFDSIAAGLPGVGEAPFNSLTIRFLGETTCDFVADAYSLFIAAAKQNCGAPTNSIAKPGDPICIEGVTASFTTNITVNALPGFGCNDVTNFEVSLTSSATLPPGACLIATLPPGVSFVPGSCQNQCALAFNCQPTVDGGQVTWQLPAGTLPSQLVCFRFATQGWSALSCENGVVLFRSAAETQALCAATGELCSTKVSTGSLILPFDPQRPAYALSDFSINATAAGANDLVEFSVDVTNSGAVSQPPTIVQFYLDTDGDGDGDQLVFTENHSQPMGSGQTVTLTGSFSLPTATSLCQLLAVIDASQQCACAGDLAQVKAPIEYQTGLSWTVCSGANQAIGVAAMPGFDYQWSPDDCLSDAQSAMTVFNCVNDDFAPATYQYTVAEGNGFCEINKLLTVTVQPVPGIAFVDSPVCQGESANLAATDGVSFNWQGPGIAQPNQQIQTVTPASTSTYSVTVTDAFGCMGMDMATVTVAPLPVVNAGPDAAFCPGDLAQLNATNDPDFDYLWSPQTVGGQPALSDPTVHDPFVLIPETIIYTLVVLDENGCSATETITAGFSPTPPLDISEDVTICLGQAATLNASSNNVLIEWMPNDGNCVDVPWCTVYEVSPSATTTYELVGTSTVTSCTVTGSVTVTVVSDEIVTNGPPVEICEGETVVINGQVVSEPGTYCETFAMPGGCDSLHCVALTVKPGIDTVVVAAAICPGDSTVFEGETYTEPGQHCVSFTAENGCDSTRCLNLTVLPPPFVELVLDADTVGVGDTLLLSVPQQNIYETIEWYANDSLLADCTGFLTCETLPTDSVMTYTVVVSNAQGCFASATRTVIVLPACNTEKVEVPNAFSPNGDNVNDVFDIVGPGSEATLNMRVWNRWAKKVYDGPGPWDGSQGGKPAAADVYIYSIKIGCAQAVEDMERGVKGDVTLLR